MGFYKHFHQNYRETKRDLIVKNKKYDAECADITVCGVYDHYLLITCTCTWGMKTENMKVEKDEKIR